MSARLGANGSTLRGGRRWGRRLFWVPMVMVVSVVPALSVSGQTALAQTSPPTLRANGQDSDNYEISPNSTVTTQSVLAGASLTGTHSWTFTMDTPNQAVTNPTISLNTGYDASRFSPSTPCSGITAQTTTLPFTWTEAAFPGADCPGQYQLTTNTLRSNISDTFSPGFDSYRTVDATSVPAGGDQHLTVGVTAQSSEFTTDSGLSVQWFSSGQTSMTSASASVVVDRSTTPITSAPIPACPQPPDPDPGTACLSFQPTTFPNPGSSWMLNHPAKGVEYEFGAVLHNNSASSLISTLPDVTVHGVLNLPPQNSSAPDTQWKLFYPDLDGPTLGTGFVTFSATEAGNWWGNQQQFRNVRYLGSGSSPPPSGGLSVFPNMGVYNGRVVQVSGSNLAHNTNYSLEQCSATPRGCDGSYSVAATTDANGNFAALGFTVHNPITVGTTTVDCTSPNASCSIAAVGGPEGTNPPFASIQFGPPPPPPDPLGSFTVTSVGNLVDQQPVYVSGGRTMGSTVQSDHDYGLAECVATICDLTPLTVHTDAAGFISDVRFVVHQTINDQTDVCLTNQCSIVMLDPATGAPATHAVPISFAISPVGPPTLRGRVTLTPLPDGKSPSGFWGVAACLGGPGCANPVFASNIGGSGYQFDRLTPGQRWDLAAYQGDSGGLHVSDHFQVTPTSGQIIRHDFVISGSSPPKGDFVKGRVLDGDAINPQPLKADPFGGPGGYPLTGVLACPAPAVYGDPSCSGVNVITTPTDDSGNYSLWLSVPAGQPSATFNIAAFTFFNAPPQGKLISGLYQQVTIYPNVDPTVDFVVPVAPNLNYTGPTTVVNGDHVALSGTARTKDGDPLGDQQLTLGLGTQSCSAWTDPTTGIATCPIAMAQAVGPVNGTAAFTTNPTYRPSSPVPGHVKDPQTITFGALTNKTFGDPPVTVAATASSGLPVTFSVTSTSAGVCTSSGTNGAKITIVGGGTCTVQADQAGNTTYAPAPPVKQSFTVARANQWILFLPLANRTMVQSPVTALAVATSGLPVTFTTTTPSVCTASGTNGRTITPVGAGVCTVTANQTGNANYNPAPPVTRSFTVSKANQTITFGSLANRKLAQSPFTVSATASSGLPVTFTASPASVCTVSGTTVTLHHTGTCTITAHQGGNNTWNPATDVTRSFRVT